MRTARALTAGGALLGVSMGRRSRVASCLAGASLLAGAACTKFGTFAAGVASAEDPVYTVRPQRRRVDEQRRAEETAAWRLSEEGAEGRRPEERTEAGGERRRAGVGVPVGTGGPNAGSNRRWPAPSETRGSGGRR